MIDSNSVEITPALRLSGVISVPGDKSISHRLAMMAAIAEGKTIIHNFAESVDCASTLECLRRLGVPIACDGTSVSIEGRGLQGLMSPSQDLDAGNSGTTVRLMSGLVAGFPFESRFIGDASLSRRPMKRVIDPLRQFGATVEAREDNFLPLKIKGGSLTPLEFTMPVASAQVKSAVLLAGLYARGLTRVHEPVQSRNHTEIALAEFGAQIRTSAHIIEVEGGNPLRGKEFSVPGDLSSAAFFLSAALAVPNSQLRLKRVGLNPTRAGFITLLAAMQAKITVEERSIAGGEHTGDVIAETSEIAGIEIAGNWVPNVIDEIPMLAVLGTRTQNGIRIRDAAELRSKESDRIHAVTTNLRALGADVEEYPDGLFVPGSQTLRGGVVDSFGDHRIAMAFAVAGLFSERPVMIKDPACVAISFPGFFDRLQEIRGNSGTVA
jgi:3-phosphoshikimate 1-carboxyvinyltransferase